MMGAVAFFNVTVSPDGKFEANSNIEDKQVIASILLDVLKTLVAGMKVEKTVIVPPPPGLDEKALKQ